MSLISLTLTFFSVLKVPLEARLREIYTPRPDRVLFVKVDEEVIYQEVIATINAARGAGGWRAGMAQSYSAVGPRLTWQQEEGRGESSPRRPVGP